MCSLELNIEYTMRRWLCNVVCAACIHTRIQLNSIHSMLGAMFTWWRIIFEYIDRIVFTNGNFLFVYLVFVVFSIAKRAVPKREWKRERRGHKKNGKGWFMEVVIIIEMPSVFACSHRQLFTLPHRHNIHTHTNLYCMYISTALNGSIEKENSSSDTLTHTITLGTKYVHYSIS